MNNTTGIDLIAAERHRQIEREGYNTTHDDAHDLGELADAAACYATQPHYRRMLQERVLVEAARGVADPDSPRQVTVLIPAGWPWDARDWKPNPQARIPELVKAGALIAAEIDRLQRNGHA